MSDQVYRILTTILLIVAFATAMAWDQAPALRWLLGTAAICCGVISTYIYFKYGRREE